MRRAVVALFVVALGASACSLLTSLDGYATGDRSDGGATDGGGPGVDGATDGATDAGVDASSSGNFGTGCDTSKPWGGAQYFAQPINTSANEYAGAFSKDGLTLYLCSDRAGQPGGGAQNDLFVARRDSLTSPWKDPVLMTELVSGQHDCDPHISDDELTITFDSDRPAQADYDLYVATRASKTAPFGAPQPLASLNTASNELEPWVTPSGDRIYYGGATGPQLLYAQRTGSTFGSGQPVPGLASNAKDESPWLTADELTIYWASERQGGKGGLDVWTATRASKDAAFTNPRAVPELSTPQSDYPTWLSADGCAMVVQTYANGSSDLFYIERQK